MSEVETVLFHFSPPIGTGLQQVLLIADGRNFRQVTLEELSRWPTRIVGANLHYLVDWFRAQNLGLPSLLGELRDATRLVTALPKSAFRSMSYPWDIRSIVSRHIGAENLPAEALIAVSGHTASSQIPTSPLPEWMFRVLKAMVDEWKVIKQALWDRGELARFFNIECVVMRVMLETQRMGICVDNNSYKQFVNEIDDDIAKSQYSLQCTLSVDPEAATTNIFYLARAANIPENLELSVERFAKEYASVSSVCSHVNRLLKAKRNRSILFRTAGYGESMLYPVFESVGTVTGRVLVTDPLIQQLSKRYRGVIRARSGRVNVYFDYSQFEPSILASLSRDEALLELCKGGNLYSVLSGCIFGSGEFRSAAKTLFLCFSYGMSLERLAALAHKLCSKDIFWCKGMVEDVFGKMFLRVLEWRKEQATLLRQQGRISAKIGSSRIRIRRGAVSQAEQRWAVSQVVQGTGAGILKNAICQIVHRLPMCNVLLPVHDALLMEMPKENLNDLEVTICNILKSEFSAVCPDVPVTVTVGSFD